MLLFVCRLCQFDVIQHGARLPTPRLVERRPRMIEQAPEVDLAASVHSRSPWFLAALALVTVGPLLVCPLAFSMPRLGESPILPVLLLVGLITGPMHVATSAFFYLDRPFRPVLRESPLRCLWSPIWLPLLLAGVGIAGALLIGRWAFLFLFTFHSVWLFYHYQRQNFGLISFVSMHLGCGSLPSRVNTAMNLAAVGGIVALLGAPGFYSMLGARGAEANAEGLLPAEAYVVLRTAGTIVYLLSLVMMVAAYRREPRLRTTVWLAAALGLGMAFFLPAILFDELGTAFLPLAIAHGAQYILMMSVMSGRSRRGWLGLALMGVLGLGLGLTLDAMRSWPLVLAGIGLVQVHFLLDAKVWRLREPRQRAIVNERFDFLLGR